MRERGTSHHKVRPDLSFPSKRLAHFRGCPEQMDDSANAARLIPTYNADAKRPEDVYPLHNIIPELEWAALGRLLSKLKNATDDHARARLLPNARSEWLRQHLMLAYSSPKPKPKVGSALLSFISSSLVHNTHYETRKMLIYASVMFAFISAVGKIFPDRTTLLERLAPAPEVVVDGLLARFTETPRNSTKCVGHGLPVILTHAEHAGPG